MPIYEYSCQSCGKRSSVFTKTFSTVAEPECEHCGGHSLERLISRVAILQSPQAIYNDYDQSSWMKDLDDGGDDSGLPNEPAWDF